MFPGSSLYLFAFRKNLPSQLERSTLSNSLAIPPRPIVAICLGTFPLRSESFVKYAGKKEVAIRIQRGLRPDVLSVVERRQTVFFAIAPAGCQ
jgi:hypothetical protein